MEYKSRTEEEEKECIRRNDIFWWNVDMRLKTMGKDSRSMSWLSREAGFPDSKLVVFRYKNKYEMRLKTVLRINEVLNATIEDLFTPLLSSPGRRACMPKDDTVNSMELTTLAISFLSKLPEIQAKSVLNHALSYLGRSLDTVMEAKDE